MKKMKLFIVTMLLTAAMSIPAWAGEWRSDGHGWWYVEDDGSYPVSQWREINGKYYYFGADGYMLADTTTPDGYQVGADGAWIQGASVQTGYLEKYAELLTNIRNGVPQGGEIDGWDDYSFQIIYVDGDAVPELVILGSTPRNYRANIRLYTYYQGNVCMLRDFYAEDFSYVEHGNWIKSMVIGSGSTIGDESFYTISEGKMVTAAWFSDAYDKYLVNGNEVSASVYESQLNAMKTGRLFKKADDSTMHGLSAENIQKMLADMGSAR